MLDITLGNDLFAEIEELLRVVGKFLALFWRDLEKISFML